MSKSINALELNITHSAYHLHLLFANHILALQNTPKIEAHNHVSQITPNVESSIKSINSINTHATRVSEHVLNNSLAARKQASNSICELSNLKYAKPASQSPIHSSLALQNTSKSKQLIQISNIVAFAQREPQIAQSQIPPI